MNNCRREINKNRIIISSDYLAAKDFSAINKNIKKSVNGCFRKINNIIKKFKKA